MGSPQGNEVKARLPPFEKPPRYLFPPLLFFLLYESQIPESGTAR
ncbi:MAG: hypothetical protein Q7R55_00625 [Candidatus Wildermuthbacteria bacterium]|nr:hypothetical protein [Candidatus Wildermuthbacteria bacterium]